MIRVGRIAALRRFPVKSMAGESCASVEIGWQGVEGDRRYAFYRSEDRGRFPWLTARDVPDMLRFAVRYRNSELPRISPVEVVVPDGRSFDLVDPALAALLAEASGCPVGLLQLGRGTHDAMPVSIATTRTHDLLDKAHGDRLDPLRFRTNILVEADMRESVWAGRKIVLGAPDAGGVELVAAEPIERCVVTTMDPVTAAREPRVMKTIARQFDNRIGLYAIPVRLGAIAVDDDVWIA